MREDFAEVGSSLEKWGQKHLLIAFQELSIAKKNEFFQQLSSFPFFEKGESFPKPSFSPASLKISSPSDEEMGKKLLKEGKAACVILAAGQGTRLGFKGPKGLFPISIVKKKSLFQIFCEKMTAVQNQLGVKLQLAIMCSKENEKEITNFFQKHTFFGLNSSQVHFFVQSELPLMDAEGKWFLDAEGKIATGPDGNGAFYNSFYNTIFPKFQEVGIENLFVIPIDNPLADPFHAELLGFHTRLQNEVSLIGVELLDPSEKMGVIVEESGKIRIMEYLHIDPILLKKALLEGKVYANTNLFCLNMSFVKKAAACGAILPNYAVKKELQQKEVYKWEKFIFDAFILAEKSSAMSCPRNRCYAPLKSQKSIPEVQQALLKLDQEILRSLLRSQVDEVPLELDMAFHYPTEALLSLWENQKPQIHAGAYLDKEGYAAR